LVANDGARGAGVSTNPPKLGLLLLLLLLLLLPSLGGEDAPLCVYPSWRAGLAR
jgi:hypothetical protein